VPLQGFNQSNIPPAVDSLPLEQLAQVLQHVPLKERLSSCALVHSSWRAAAAEATTEIECSYNSNSLSAWLRSHCSKVCIISMSIKTPDRTLSLMPLRLPVIHLQYLLKLEFVWTPWESTTVSAGQQPLQISREQQGALPGLASLTALTRLDLTGASVRLDGLEALTGLKELSISYDVIERSDSRAFDEPPVAYFDIAEALLSAALPKLQHLTRLCLQGKICSSKALAQVSTMQRLEQLDLKYLAIRSLPTMPQSLTQILISSWELPPMVFTNSSQLTGLQKLTVWTGQYLDTTLLEGMVGLREVMLSASALTAANTQPLLVFSRLTALESLSLLCYERVQLTPGEAPALTVSSHLTHLRLALGSRWHNGGYYSLQEAHYEARFPADRQLQQLCQLHVGTALLSSTVALQQLTGLSSLTLEHRVSDGVLQLQLQ